MPKQIWICEKCKRHHDSESNATRCEMMHQQPIEYKVLSWLECRPFPSSILAKLPPELGEYDYAVYKIDHIGPRGC